MQTRKLVDKMLQKPGDNLEIVRQQKTLEAPNTDSNFFPENTFSRKVFGN